MIDYDQARPYLHSRRLRWSYGAIKGREGDIWSRGVAAKPTQEMIETLAWAGFSGVYVDRFGYTDNRTQIESKLPGILNSSPIISPHERQVFFDPTAYQRNCERTISAGAVGGQTRSGAATGHHRLANRLLRP